MKYAHSPTELLSLNGRQRLNEKDCTCWHHHLLFDMFVLFRRCHLSRKLTQGGAAAYIFVQRAPEMLHFFVTYSNFSQLCVDRQMAAIISSRDLIFTKIFKAWTLCCGSTPNQRHLSKSQQKVFELDHNRKQLVLSLFQTAQAHISAFTMLSVSPFSYIVIIE